MDWLRENLPWIIIAIVFIWIHVRMHGGSEHGGCHGNGDHSGHGRHRNSQDDHGAA